MQLTFGLRRWMTDFIDCIIASWGLSVDCPWSNFSAVSTVLWTKSAPEDTAGRYRVVRILGAALGSLLGGFIPLYYGFPAVFTVSAVISGISLFFFSFQAHQQW